MNQSISMINFLFCFVLVLQERKPILKLNLDTIIPFFLEFHCIKSPNLNSIIYVSCIAHSTYRLPIGLQNIYIYSRRHCLVIKFCTIWCGTYCYYFTITKHQPIHCIQAIIIIAHITISYEKWRREKNYLYAAAYAMFHVL